MKHCTPKQKIFNIKQENHHENGEPKQKVAKDLKKQLIFRSNFGANKKIARLKLFSVRFMSAKWVFRFLKLA